MMKITGGIIKYILEIVTMLTLLIGGCADAVTMEASA